MQCSQAECKLKRWCCRWWREELRSTDLLPGDSASNTQAHAQPDQIIYLRSSNAKNREPGPGEVAIRSQIGVSARLSSWWLRATGWNQTNV